MPIYEFFSPNTNKIYSFYSRTMSIGNHVPVCPDGKNYKMKKIISGFSITGGNGGEENLQDDMEGSNEADPFSKLSEAQTANVMKEMEKAVGGMDDENPDPRQMGSLMRKMCEMTGEKMDDAMEEVVRKLEEGTNPEELEAKMEGFMGEENNDCELSENASSNAKTKNKIRRFLVRDPMLYEMSDYIP
jgi:hypothetical protein